MDVIVAWDEHRAQSDLGGGFLRLINEHGRESYINKRSCITLLLCLNNKETESGVDVSE